MYIYRITNLLNGKIYIGQTIRDPDIRFRQHCLPSSASLISRAIRRIGKENFSFEVIAKCSSLQDLDKLEIENIIKHNSLIPNGYNVSPGGQYLDLRRKDGSSKEFYLYRALIKFNRSFYGSGILKGVRTEEHVQRSRDNIKNVISQPTIPRPYSTKRALEIYRKNGIASYGYEVTKDKSTKSGKKLSVSAYQQRVILVIQKYHLLGYSSKEIAGYLSHMLIPPSGGKQWKPAAISKIIANNPIDRRHIKETMKLRMNIENNDIRESDRPKIRLIRFMFFMGLSLKKIAMELNMMKIPTIDRSPLWNKAHIDRIIKDYPLIEAKMPDMSLINNVIGSALQDSRKQESDD